MCVCVSSFFVRHISLQNNVNGGVEPWSLVTKGKTLVTKGKDLGDKKNDLNDQRKDLDESKAAMPQALESKTNIGSAKPNQLPVQVLEKKTATLPPPFF